MSVSSYFFPFVLSSQLSSNLPKEASHGYCQSGLGQIEDRNSAGQSEAGEDPSENSAGRGEGEEAGHCFERGESSFEKGKVADEEVGGEGGEF